MKTRNTSFKVRNKIRILHILHFRLCWRSRWQNKKRNKSNIGKKQNSQYLQIGEENIQIKL